MAEEDLILLAPTGRCTCMSKMYENLSHIKQVNKYLNY